MKKPNLFSYATSELSQDAFICWLLSWASPELKDEKKLHECATNFILSIFNKHNINFSSSIKSVEIKKQYNNIDILCIIDDIYVILIEDKTKTKNHSDQLNRYFNIIKKDSRFKEKNIVPIYLKTGDQSSYSDIEESGYKVFLRIDFLNILNAYNGTNTILIDYRKYIQSISDSVESYKSKILKNWDRNSWIGFYIELQKHINGAKWDYTNNPSGGFMGFAWHSYRYENFNLYLQLEENKLCFKIKVNTKSNRTSLRNKWSKDIINKAKGDISLSIKLKKPNRFGHGEYMTVCILIEDYRKTKKDGTIDISKTISKLKKAEKLLKLIEINNTSIIYR